MVMNMVKLYKEDVEMAVCLMHEWYELKIELLETDVDKWIKDILCVNPKNFEDKTLLGRKSSKQR